MPSLRPLPAASIEGPPQPPSPKPRRSQSSTSPRPPILTTLPPPSISTTSVNRAPTAEQDDAENDEGFALIPPRMVLESSDSEDEGTPRPLSSATRVSWSPKVPGNERQEEQPVPSVVAN